MNQGREAGARGCCSPLIIFHKSKIYIYIYIYIYLYIFVVIETWTRLVVSRLSRPSGQLNTLQSFTTIDACCYRQSRYVLSISYILTTYPDPDSTWCSPYSEDVPRTARQRIGPSGYTKYNVLYTSKAFLNLQEKGQGNKPTHFNKCCEQNLFPCGIQLSIF